MQLFWLSRLIWARQNTPERCNTREGCKVWQHNEVNMASRSPGYSIWPSVGFEPCISCPMLLLSVSISTLNMQEAKPVVYDTYSQKYDNIHLCTVQCLTTMQLMYEDHPPGSALRSVQTFCITQRYDLPCNEYNQSAHITWQFTADVPYWVTIQCGCTAWQHLCKDSKHWKIPAQNSTCSLCRNRSNKALTPWLWIFVHWSTLSRHCWAHHEVPNFCIWQHRYCSATLVTCRWVQRAYAAHLKKLVQAWL